MALHDNIHGHHAADLEDIRQVPEVPESFDDGHAAVFEAHHSVAGARVAGRVDLATGVFVGGEGGAEVEGDPARDDDAVRFDHGFEVVEEGAGGEGHGHGGGAVGEVGEPEVGGADEVGGFCLGGWGSHGGSVGGRPARTGWLNLGVLGGVDIVDVLWIRDLYVDVRGVGGGSTHNGDKAADCDDVEKAFNLVLLEIKRV